MLRVRAEAGFWLVLGLMVLLFPLPVVSGILLAAAIHELGHILALQLCGGRIHRIVFHNAGLALTFRIVGDG